MPESLEQRIKGIIAEQLNVEMTAISGESRFIEDLGADSLDIVELVMAFEETFHLDIPDEKAEEILKVSDAVEFIKTMQKKSHSR